MEINKIKVLNGLIIIEAPEKKKDTGLVIPETLKAKTEHEELQKLINTAFKVEAVPDDEEIIKVGGYVKLRNGSTLNPIKIGGKSFIIIERYEVIIFSEFKD
jgi:co-chaperonin GroES (HSP10)